MKNWLDRVPRTMRDWLSLFTAAALILLVVSALPRTAGGVSAVLKALSPFAGGIAVAYVVDIPTRFFAEKLFHGKRGFAIVLSYICFIGVVAALIGLVVPQLIMSVSSFVNALPGYLDNAAAAIGGLMTDLNIGNEIVQRLTAWFDNTGNTIQNTITELMPRVAGAAGSVAGSVVDAVVALAASIYLLADRKSVV